jgi:hypothetical protein
MFNVLRNLSIVFPDRLKERFVGRCLGHYPEILLPICLRTALNLYLAIVAELANINAIQVIRDKVSFLLRDLRWVNFQVNCGFWNVNASAERQSLVNFKPYRHNCPFCYYLAKLFCRGGQGRSACRRACDSFQNKRITPNGLIGRRIGIEEENQAGAIVLAPIQRFMGVFELQRLVREAGFLRCEEDSQLARRWKEKGFGLRGRNKVRYRFGRQMGHRL